MIHDRFPLPLKQDLSSLQPHERLQFAVDLTAATALHLDASKIILLDEFRPVLRDENPWKHLRLREWNDTAFVTRGKLPASLMTCGTIGVSFKSGCLFCFDGADSGEYLRIVNE
jgi:hypothetical protein